MKDTGGGKEPTKKEVECCHRRTKMWNRKTRIDTGVAKMASHAIFQYNILAIDDTHNTWTNMIVKINIPRLLGSSDDKEKIGVARPEGPPLRGFRYLSAPLLPQTASPPGPPLSGTKRLTRTTAGLPASLPCPRPADLARPLPQRR